MSRTLSTVDLSRLTFMYAKGLVIPIMTLIMMPIKNIIITVEIVSVLANHPLNKYNVRLSICRLI